MPFDDLSSRRTDEHGWYPDDAHDGQQQPAQPPGRRRPLLRRAALITAAALVPLTLAGWLGWHATTRTNGGHGAASADAASTAAPGTAGGGAAGPSAGATGAAGAKGANGTGGASRKKPLAGLVVAIDPGHNPTNYSYPSKINAPVFVGTESKPCDTTGTATDSGYPEADFTLDVSRRLRALLEAEGAKVVLTQDGSRPWGPCVTERAAIGNDAHADAAVSIHADGAPAKDYGFHVILPAAVHEHGIDNRKITAPSRTLGLDLRSAFAKATGEHYATYINGGTGLDVRSDLGGLNLSTVPKVFIECGNMRNATDALHTESAAWRQKAAQGLANGLTAYLEATR